MIMAWQDADAGEEVHCDFEAGVFGTYDNDKDDDKYSESRALAVGF